MSRNSTADQILTERLVTNDTKAFEELYHRYWYSLYFMGLRKLHCTDESRQLVQAVFVDLWQKRHSLTASFNVAQYLYEEGKKDIAARLEQKSMQEPDDELVMEHADTIHSVHSDTTEMATQQRKLLVKYVRNTGTVVENRRAAQSWPSATKLNTYMTCKEKDQLEHEILEEIKAHTAYPLFFPKKESPWWQKIAAMF